MKMGLIVYFFSKVQPIANDGGRLFFAFLWFLSGNKLF
jgi:hypothetical protein